MKQMSWTCIFCAAWLLLMVPVAARSSQTATANGQCVVAINASGHAVVTVNNNCDAKLAATVQRLLDKTRQQDKVIFGQLKVNATQERQIGQVTADLESLRRLVEDWIAAIEQTNKVASAPNASPADKHAAEMLELGDASDAAEILAREAEKLVTSSEKNRLSAISFFVQQAALLRASDKPKALQALQRALSIAPYDVGILSDCGVLALQLGNTRLASSYYKRSYEAAELAVKADPENTERLRALRVSLNNFGDLLVIQGDREKATKYFKDALDITIRLLKRNEHNVLWRQDMGFSYDRLGDLSRHQGDLPAARRYYHESLNISEELSEVNGGICRYGVIFLLRISR